jgi:hypothetical protein
VKPLIEQQARIWTERTALAAIVLLLMSLSLPLYGQHVRSSRLLEATAHIGEIVNEARTYAIENQDLAGDPLWPSVSQGLVSLSSTANFDYRFSRGNGRSARTTPLEIEAHGKVGTRVAGVTLRVSVPNLYSAATPPRVTGF